jgi:hypothetical protein
MNSRETAAFKTINSRQTKDRISGYDCGRQFDEPIELPDGRKLVPLRERSRLHHLGHQIGTGGTAQQVAGLSWDWV